VKTYFGKRKFGAKRSNSRYASSLRPKLSEPLAALGPLAGKYTVAQTCVCSSNSPSCFVFIYLGAAGTKQISAPPAALVLRQKHFSPLPPHSLDDDDRERLQRSVCGFISGARV